VVRAGRVPLHTLGPSLAKPALTANIDNFVSVRLRTLFLVVGQAWRWRRESKLFIRPCRP